MTTEETLISQPKTCLPNFRPIKSATPELLSVQVELSILKTLRQEKLKMLH